MIFRVTEDAPLQIQEHTHAFAVSTQVYKYVMVQVLLSELLQLFAFSLIGIKLLHSFIMFGLMFLYIGFGHDSLCKVCEAS